jgi:hypothetical protein
VFSSSRDVGQDIEYGDVTCSRHQQRVRRPAVGREQLVGPKPTTAEPVTIEGATF